MNEKKLFEMYVRVGEDEPNTLSILYVLPNLRNIEEIWEGFGEYMRIFIETEYFKEDVIEDYNQSLLFLSPTLWIVKDIITFKDDVLRSELEDSVHEFYYKFMDDLAKEDGQ